jgi:nicotinamidase-related amidase
MMRVSRDDSLLLVIDIQRKLAPAIAGHEKVLARTEALVSAAELLGIPKLVTEHCPQQIGPLIEPLRSRFAADEIFEKTAFAATDHPQFIERVRASGRQQIVMTGMEAHVCVMQAALGLRAAGFDVCIVADAAGSRAAAQFDRELALSRMAAAGCWLAGTETVLFEWTGSGTDPNFRAILPIVKSL